MTFLLTSSVQEWQFDTATDIQWSGIANDIATDIQWSRMDILH